MVTTADKITDSKHKKEGHEYPRLQGSFIANGYQWLRNPYALLDSAHARCGLTFEAHLPVVGKALISGDPELIRATLRNRLLIGGRGTRALRPLLGNDSLIILEDRAHTARKQLLSTAFQLKSVRRHDQLTIDCCLHEIEQLPRSAPFSIFQVVRKITLQSIIRSLFGPLDQRKRDQLTGLINNYMNSFSNPLFLFIKPLQRDWGSFSPWGRLQRRRDHLRRFVQAEIDRHRQQHGQPDCVLGSMIEAVRSKHQKISDESIFNELLGLLLFGHDTSAVTMAWSFYHLYSQPSVKDCLQAEIADVFDVGDYLNSAQPSYLRCCILESMRLCPVVAHLTRVAIGDTRLGDHQLKSGDKVLPSAYLAQRNPAVFPEPEAFNPDRFANGEDYGDSYFPFGFGARKCIGEHLAMRQMELIIYCFTRELNLELDPGYQARVQRKMLLIGPADGTLMRVRRN